MLLGLAGAVFPGRKGQTGMEWGRGNEEGSSGRERPKGILGINPFLSLELTGLEIVPLATEKVQIIQVEKTVQYFWSSSNDLPP